MLRRWWQAWAACFRLSQALGGEMVRGEEMEGRGDQPLHSPGAPFPDILQWPCPCHGFCWLRHPHLSWHRRNIGHCPSPSSWKTSSLGLVPFLPFWQRAPPRLLLFLPPPRCKCSGGSDPSSHPPQSISHPLGMSLAWRASAITSVPQRWLPPPSPQPLSGALGPRSHACPTEPSAHMFLWQLTTWHVWNPTLVSRKWPWVPEASLSRLVWTSRQYGRLSW